jgi:transcriptional pleiotropic regulator of transition state genes
MTGVIRRTDRLGRLCLPRGMRQLLAIDMDTPIEIVLDSDRLVLRKYTPGCSSCSEREVFRSVCGVRLCRNCFEVMTGASQAAVERGGP